MTKETNQNLFHLFKHLIKFRHQILNKEKSNKTKFFYENPNHRILAYTRSENIVIITNFSSQMRSNYEIKSFPSDSQWVDWLTNEMYSVNNSVININLKPFDGKILLRQI